MLRVFDVDGRGGGCCAVLAHGEAACGAEDVKSRGPLEEGEGRGRGMVVEIKRAGTALREPIYRFVSVF